MVAKGGMRVGKRGGRWIVAAVVVVTCVASVGGSAYATEPAHGSVSVAGPAHGSGSVSTPVGSPVHAMGIRW